MKVRYELIPYEVDEEHLGAEHTAEILGEPIERIFKTLVLRGDRTGLFVCVIPGAEEMEAIGITTDALNRLEEAAKALRQKDAEVDELRRQANKKAHENMDLIADLKAQMLVMRKAVKGHYPQYEWIKYGVQDKR